MGVAVGEAASTALEPVFEPIKQDAWHSKPTKVLEAAQLAQLVAEAQAAMADVLDDVERNGYNSDKLTQLVQLALKAPGAPEAEQLFLRGANGYTGGISQDQLNHAYAKSGLEFQYWGPRQAAATTKLLTPAELALGVVRSTVQDSGLLVVTLDTSDSNVAQYPTAALDTLAEFAAAGIDAERARAMVGAIGLPMAVELAARATYRNILTKGAYYQAVLEGDTRPEWADSIFEVARQIPTAEQYLENYLRGYTTDFNTALGNAALHGMSSADATLVFQNMGRPLAVHQITTGLARGGVFQPEPGELSDPYEASVHESNIKPGYYDLAIANRYEYPPLFQVVSLLKAGDITPDTATTWLLYDGYEPGAVQTLVEALSPSGTVATARVKTAQTKLITAAEKAYTNGASTVAEATSDLTVAGVEAADIPVILAAWDQIKAIEARTTPTTSG